MYYPRLISLHVYEHKLHVRTFNVQPCIKNNLLNVLTDKLHTITIDSVRQQEMKIFKDTIHLYTSTSEKEPKTQKCIRSSNIAIYFLVIKAMRMNC